MRALLEERAAVLRAIIDETTLRIAQLKEAVGDDVEVAGSTGQRRTSPHVIEIREQGAEQRRALREMTDVVRRLETVDALEAANAATAWRRPASRSK